jgi:hypothetical protein
LAKLRFLARTIPVFVCESGKYRGGRTLELPDDKALSLLDAYPGDFEVIGKHPAVESELFGSGNVKNLRIALPDGIGDCHWTLLKLESMKKKLKAKRMTLITQSTPKHHATDFLKLVPFVDSVESDRSLNLSCSSRDGWFVDKNSLYYLWAFRGLQKNNNDINQWMPEFDVNYNYPIDIPESDWEYAENYVKQLGYKPIIFHMSWRSLDTGQVSNYWSADKFNELAELIYSHTKRKIVIVAQKFEQELVRNYIDRYSPSKYIDLSAQTTLPKLLALMSNASFVFGFQSGVTFLSVHAKIPSALLWAVKNVTQITGYKFEREYMTSFTPPEATDNWYFPCVLGEDDPKTIWQKIKNVF